MARPLFTHNSLVLAAVTVTFGFSHAIALAADGAAPGVPVAATTPDIETSKYSFVGEVNTDGTLVRSGPSENDYQVLKLAKNTRVTVVGMRFEWLKVSPPEGSFCLVPQAFIDKSGNGTVGRVINKGAPVRIGSALTQAMHKILPRQLEPGESVTIVGETPTGEFYKIAPPKDVYMYIDKKYVNPVRRTDAEAATGVLAATPSAAPSADNTGAQTATTVQPTPGVTTPSPEGAAQTDDRKFVVKSETPEDSAGAIANADQNAAAIRSLQEKLSKLEDRYAAVGKQEQLDPKPLDELSADYATLLADKQLPPNARRVAEYRASQLKVRKEALVEFAAAKKTQEEAAQKQRDLKAEQDELAARVAATSIKHYAAVGRLLQSSLQVGGQTLYRLVDPANGHLILYVRSSKVPVAGGLDKFVAINGKVVRDDAVNLTYVQPESFEVVDPKQLNTKIFADYSPPSMVTANVTGQASAQ